MDILSNSTFVQNIPVNVQFDSGVQVTSYFVQNIPVNVQFV